MVENILEKNKSSATLRALSILEAIAQSEKPLTATEINAELNLPKPTIHRLCSMLEKNGYLQQHIDGRGYVHGSKLSKMALGVLNNNYMLRIEQHAVLKRLSDEIGETCNIAIPDGTEIIYFDRVETNLPLRVQFQVNDRVPMHCTASGKLFLSYLPLSRRRRVIEKLKLKKITENTITDIEQLAEAVENIKKEGVGIDNEEFVQGMVAVSVPMISSKGHFYGALAMHAPIVRMSLYTCRSKVPQLKTAAREIVDLIESL